MGPESSRGAAHRRVLAATSADLRRDNLGRLLRLVHDTGPLTRAALTEHLHLARGTVGVLLDWLVAAGMIREQPAELNGTRGRPSPVVGVVPGAATTLALDLGVDAVGAAVVGLGGRVLGRQLWPHDLRRSADETVANVVHNVKRAAAARRRAGAIYQAVGVACWGVVRNSDGFVHTAPNLDWHDVPLGAALHEALAVKRGTGRPTVQHVVVANDADLGAMMEYRRGAGVGARRLLYVHSDIGLGGGLVYDGRLLGADGGYTGEIGHMRVNPNGIRCRCGTVGCWETEVDERALLRRAGVSAPAEGPAVAEAVDAVLAGARNGQRPAVTAVKHVAAALGDGLANLVHVLGPDRIVLGGYLADLLDVSPSPIRHALAERGFSPDARHVPVMPAQHRKDAALLGAAEYAFGPLLHDPQAALSEA